MKKIIGIAIGVFLILGACSNSEDRSESNEGMDMATEEDSSMPDTAQKNDSLSEGDMTSDTNNVIGNVQEQMMVYHADVSLRTRDYDSFYEQLESHIDKQEAYIIEANVHKMEQGQRSANIRIRVPQENFRPFIDDLGSYSDNIDSRNISGRDVTEEYVDLESRLKAKEKIEERLLTFMDDAEKTEDLIEISQDLERVQEEIETIKGKMNYLENQSDYSTVSLSITETKVNVPDLKDQDLNTWEKTKQAFVQSLNGLTQAASWIVVALIGYSPILVLLAIPLIWWLLRKRKHRTTDQD
ncbi:DUF4349 domain-containing protein [Thalassobacillus sp. B23F22_16]|uniref:DUF4349 domain-containing protein n=1 Tax=Thalassobacillus sp. B23F22_16 TaxID=3459513 RepID=UPI00373EAAB7